MKEQIIDMDDAIETIYYTPKGGSELTLSGHVFRKETMDRNMPHNALNKKPDLSIWIQNDSVPDVTKNADKVRILRNRGDSTYQTKTVRDILSQDAGCWVLELT